MDAPATLLAGADVKAAAEGRSALEHAAETKTGVRTGGVAVAVVGHVDVELVRVRADAHVCARRVGVAQHIGQRLLDDPEGRSADCRRDGSTIDIHVDVRVQPGGACLFHEAGE